MVTTTPTADLLPTPREIIMRCLSDPKQRMAVVAQGYAGLCKLIEDHLAVAGYQIVRRPQPIAGDAWEEAIAAAAEVAERYRLGTLRLHEKAKTEKRDRLSDNHEGASDCAEEIRDAIRALRRPAQPQPSGTELTQDKDDALTFLSSLSVIHPHMSKSIAQVADCIAALLTAAIDRPAREGDVERVARAICRATLSSINPNSPEADYLVDQDWRHSITEARAALAAMRGDG